LAINASGRLYLNCDNFIYYGFKFLNVRML
jgi:hypothetical protein